MKDLNKYFTICPKCGRETEIKSNEPSGGLEPFICSCFDFRILQISENVKGKYLYKTREDTRKFQLDIFNVIQDIHSAMTVRQIYYRLVASGYAKEETTYNKTQRTLLDLRERGLLPYGLIADNTRSFYKPRTYSNLENMLEEQQRYYRKDFWESQDCYVEIWLEKEALRTVFSKVTSEFQIPLYVSKGLSSVSFVYSASEEIKAIDKTTFIYFFSDWDPTGLILTKSIENRMREFGVKAEFIRAGLTPDQIEKYKVLTRPTKESKHSRNFKGESAELDALHPRILEELIKKCILAHVDMKAFMRLQDVEFEEVATLRKITNNLRHACIIKFRKGKGRK
jgi:hypothetical protein